MVLRVTSVPRVMTRIFFRLDQLYGFAVSPASNATISGSAFFSRDDIVMGLWGEPAMGESMGEGLFEEREMR